MLCWFISKKLRQPPPGPPLSSLASCSSLQWCPWCRTPSLPWSLPSGRLQCCVRVHLHLIYKRQKCSCSEVLPSGLLGDQTSLNQASKRFTRDYSWVTLVQSTCAQPAGVLSYVQQQRHPSRHNRLLQDLYMLLGVDIQGSDGPTGVLAGEV